MRRIFTPDRIFKAWMTPMAVAALAGLTLLVLGIGHRINYAVASDTYKRPATVSAQTERHAQVLAEQIAGEPVSIRFDADAVCRGVRACVFKNDHRVIHLPAQESIVPGSFAGMVLHEAVHTYVFEHDLDVSEFGAIDPSVPAEEAVADCAARILSRTMTNYIDCPAEWQLRALDVLGIERAATIYIDREAQVGVWR